jgi:hypothetical protein
VIRDLQTRTHHQGHDSNYKRPPRLAHAHYVRNPKSEEKEKRKLPYQNGKQCNQDPRQQRQWLLSPNSAYE